MKCSNCSDGKAVDSELKGPGFKPRPREENVKTIFSCFGLFALRPMRSTSKYSPICFHMYMAWE